MSAYLVTGAAGFIGARFVESCNRRGISVLSIDERRFFPGSGPSSGPGSGPSSGPGSINDARLEHAGIDFGTIIDRDELFDWLDENASASTGSQTSISAVVHMGACSRTTETDVEYLRRVNVEYSQKLWNYCTEHRIPLIYASSAATYGGGELGYADEEATLPRLQPLNDYGRSKQIFDVWALEQERAGRKPPTWAGFKFFNVYGFGERHKGSQASVVLHAYDQILTAGKVRLFRSHRPGIADGEQKRDFVAIEDVVSALHFALEKPIPRGVLNLGTGRAQSFLELAHAVFEALGKPPRIEFVDTPAEIREKYQYFTEARMSRLRAEGYSAPFMDLREGVRSYLERLGSR